MIIYRIYDKTTGENFVDYTTVTVAQRIHIHLMSKASSIGKNMLDKGINNFDVSVIDICLNIDDLAEVLAYWKEYYNAINQ